MKPSSRDLADLAGAMPDKVRAVIAACKSAGFELLVYATFRNGRDQAILYRRTRTKWAIDQKIASLEKRGFYALARILRDVGPQSGPLGKHVTGAAPGESCHQHGLAVDAVPVVHGKPDWEMDCKEAWATYAYSIEAAGLNWAGRWIHNQESLHFQAPPAGNMLDILIGSPAAIEDGLLVLGAL